MTSSYSKQNGKQRDDTVSQTGKRQFSQSFDQQQSPTVDNTNNNSFDITVQNLMPLIQHLKEENQQVKHQRDQIQSEMIKLKSLSEQILEENARMRQHYQQRTDDIRKIVATMSINMNQQIQDINHMSHMTKNHNYTIVKNIEQAKRQIQQRAQEVQKIQQELAALSERNTLLEEQIITRNVKIRQMEDKLDELQAQRSKQDNLFKLQDQVDKLHQEVAALRQKNMKKLKNCQSIQTKNQMEKPHYTAENLNAIQTIKTLSQQISQMKEDTSSFQKKLENLKNYHKKLSQKCQKANQQRQKQTIKNEDQQNEVKKIKQNILITKTKCKQVEVKKSALEEEKYDLEKKINKKQQNILKIKNESYKEKENIKNQFKQKASKQRTQHYVQTEKNQDELKFHINPETQRMTQNLQQLKDEYRDLNKQVQQMKITIKNMENPIKEIIRLEYELKKLSR